MTQLEVAEAQLSRALSLLRCHYNFGLAVDRLLPELLVQVFEFVIQDPELPDASYSGRMKALNKLASVSRAWRAAALGCASFWTTIDSAYPETSQLCLERSKETLLEIHVDGDTAHGLQVAEALIDAVPRFRRLRVRDLELQPEGEDDALRKLLTNPGPVPHLESLVVRTSEVPVLPAKLFGGHTPNLSVVCLSGCYFPIDSISTTALRNLHILSINLKLDWVLDVLRSSPVLEEFLFQSAKIEEPRHPIPDGTLVHMPNCRVFNIEDKAMYSMIPDLLTYISLPKTSCLYVHLGVTQPRRFANILPPKRTRCFESLTGITHLRVRDSGSGDMIRFSGQSHDVPFEVQVDLGDQDDIDFVEAGEDVFRFLATLDLDLVEELEIDLDLKGAHTFVDDWRKLLRQMPALHTLYLGEAGHSHSILTVLSELDETSRAFLCPNLQTLYMGKDTSWSPLDIYLFVQERARNGLTIRRICLRVRQYRADNDSDTEDDLEEVPTFIRKRDLTVLRGVVESVEMVPWVTPRRRDCDRIDRVMLELPEIPAPDRTFCF
ncbi:hypothetical protein PUNSTDRAFT_53635 [Punctularia strigosozonata HHB-11173 SS5]|uniref:uncharacterized protein n=1 Tax=Punctularia strigosozonata (strain HHB-11173) TaxID=741275 RepID=UPI0004417176|nr:uncharacterized protein PUNSTDRAFT_53635 [Punctularia strigosozonata HHB-11173 SS5]EIN07284.1 hypothetical protein PUNSTDRAFT_53635 [Punctularia strigosozonata HHB-11173 SS5]